MPVLRATGENPLAVCGVGLYGTWLSKILESLPVPQGNRTRLGDRRVVELRSETLGTVVCAVGGTALSTLDWMFRASRSCSSGRHKALSFDDLSIRSPNTFDNPTISSLVVLLTEEWPGGYDRPVDSS